MMAVIRERERKIDGRSRIYILYILSYVPKPHDDGNNYHFSVNTCNYRTKPRRARLVRLYEYMYIYIFGWTQFN